jgi:ElaB/YqjD/DUF883 family membrane-anchored ribosome-binding protein
METYFGEIQKEMTAPPTREKLAEDLRILARDAEDLLKATAGDMGDKLNDQAKAARARLATALETAKTTYQQLGEKTLEGAKAADRVIRAHPYESIGAALGLGVLLGLLIGRK